MGSVRPTTTSLVSIPTAAATNRGSGRVAGIGHEERFTADDEAVRDAQRQQQCACRGLPEQKAVPRHAAEGRTTPDAFTRLLGSTRANVLMRAVEPVSTSSLVSLTGMPLGTVGSRLQVLLDAGLLQRRRSGREVLYWWSASTHDFVAGMKSQV